jgi:hypothetical protein
MARLTRKKCARNLIEAKVVVKASGDRVKVAKVVVKASGAQVKAAKVVVKASGAQVKAAKVAPVPVVVKTHADPAKAIEISLAPAEVMPKAC